MSTSRATWSSRKDKACSECGASSTGARNTRGLGGAERGWVFGVVGSESVATSRGFAPSPVASRGVLLMVAWEEEADLAIARVFSLHAFVCDENSRKLFRRFFLVLFLVSPVKSVADDH